MNYESIQNAVPSSINAKGTLHCTKGDVAYDYTYNATCPQSETRSMETYSKNYTCYNSDRSNASFTNIRKSGIIKMTNYSIASVETYNYLMSNPDYSASLGWPQCTDGSDFAEQVKSIASWEVVESYDDIVKRRPDAPHYILYEIGDIEATVNRVQSAVVSDSYQSLDALTTFSEIGESLKLIRDSLTAVRHPLKAFGKLRKRILKRNKFSLEKSNSFIADAWLQYRYAIMPEILTVKDSIQLLNDRGYMFKTSRSIDPVPIRSLQLPNQLPTFYFTHSLDGSVVVRGTGKARFDSSSRRLFDQISFNPVLTAWELVPYSFVVDWFVNVGDVISAKSLQLADFASQRKFCYSVKQETTEKIVYHNYGYRCNFTKDYNLGTVEWDSGPLGGDHLLRKIVRTSYDRVLFDPGDVKLQLKPNLTWRRWLDAYSLSLGPVTRALKKL